MNLQGSDVGKRLIWMAMQTDLVLLSMAQLLLPVFLSLVPLLLCQGDRNSQQVWVFGYGWGPDGSQSRSVPRLTTKVFVTERGDGIEINIRKARADQVGRVYILRPECADSEPVEAEF